MKNPFIFGKVVVGSDFADREEELKTLVRELKAGGRIFLISPRRYGKTSLIMNVQRQLKESGFLTAYLDLYRAPSLERFASLYAQAVSAAAETKLEGMLRVAKETLSALRPEISISERGEPSISIDVSARRMGADKILDYLLAAPEKIAFRKKRDFVVAFDEFQEIASLDGEKMEKILRANFQQHRHVSYIFAGSKKRLLYDMVSNRSRPFYKMGQIMALGKIPQREFAEYLLKKFEETGFRLEEGVIEKVLEAADNYPYNVQYLCHELWNENMDSKRIKVSNVEPTLNKIVDAQSPLYITLWDSLAPHQRKVLRAITSSPDENIFSGDFIRAHELGAAPSVQTSLKLLMKRDILDKENKKYVMTDVFFAQWIKRMQALS